MFTTQHSNRQTRMLATPVRAHVRELIAAGYPPKLIARLAGLETRRVTRLLSDHTERGERRYEQMISTRTGHQLLAVPIPSGLFVAAVGPVRRLQALIRIGHSFSTIAAALGYDEILLAEIALGAFDIVDAEFAEKIGGLFDRWYLRPGPSMEARELGRRHRFAAPLAWAVDDDDEAGSIDDPAAEPVGLPPVDNRGVPADFAEIVADHRDLGHYDETIAVAMGVSANTFAKRLHRAGIGEHAAGNGRNMTRPALYGARYRVRLVGVAS